MAEDTHWEEDQEQFEHYHIAVDPGQSLLRIDRFLNDKLPNISRNKIQEAAKNGHIRVDGQPVKANYKVKPGQAVTLVDTKPREVFELVPEDLPLQVVYEDQEVMVINKEAGMVVHPGHGNWQGTLVNALAFRLQDLPTQSDQLKPGLVHRIDKDTSGLMVVAKTEAGMAYLSRQFADHSIERTYYALVWGEPKEQSGTIIGHIGRSLKDRRMSAVFPEGDYGKHAVTHWKVLERLRYVALVQCNLETGRTHQIRAHMKYIGHPLFSDAMYGGDQILKGQRFSKYRSFVENCFSIMPRQALHAKSLGFTHPATHQWMAFSSELPEDFSEVLERWRKYLQYH